MTQDAYWDELGIAWTAISPNAEIVAPRMKGRLRRQTALTAAIVFLGLPFAFAGAVLGAWTIWHGAAVGAWFFIPRGIGILATSLLAGFAAWSFISALKDNSQSLAAMIGLALLRSERWLSAIRLGYLSLGITALFGTMSGQMRNYMGKPAAMPHFVPFVVLAVMALVLYLLERKAKSDIMKYRYLKQLLLDEPR